MINVRTPQDSLFNYAECEELYNSCRKELKDVEFDEVLNNSMFYSFYIALTGELIGCIYFYKKKKKLFVNAFARRGHHRLNLECFKKTLEWFTCNIYAEATEKTSRMCVLRCGFERIKGNLFVYRRKKK